MFIELVSQESVFTFPELVLATDLREKINKQDSETLCESFHASILLIKYRHEKKLRKLCEVANVAGTNEFHVKHMFLDSQDCLHHVRSRK